MHALNCKLKSKNGASIIIAMVFFLFCAMVGAVVLTSANANAGRLGRMYDEQQAYLTLSSAAKLVQAEISGAEYYIENVQRKKTDLDNNLIEEVPLETTSKITPDNGVLSEFLLNYISNVCAAHINGTEFNDDDGVEFTIAAVGFEDVTAVFKMDSGHNVHIELSLDDFSMIIEMQAVVTDLDFSEIEEFYNEEPPHKLHTLTSKHTVTWKKAIISRGGTR